MSECGPIGNLRLGCGHGRRNRSGNGRGNNGSGRSARYWNWNWRRSGRDGRSRRPDVSRWQRPAHTFVRDLLGVRRLAPRDPPRVERILAAGQNLRLLDPVFLLNATVETELATDPSNVIGTPLRNVGVARYPEAIEHLLQRGIYGPDPL